MAWQKESLRHSLARRGIKTPQRSKLIDTVNVKGIKINVFEVRELKDKNEKRIFNLLSEKNKKEILTKIKAKQYNKDRFGVVRYDDLTQNEKNKVRNFILNTLKK